MGDIGEEQEPVIFEPVERPVHAAAVVDASALVYATTDSGALAAALRHRLAQQVCHAPYLIDAEVGSVLRRKVVRGEMSAAHAEAVLHAAPALIDVRHEHHGVLGSAAWQLRDNITFYDGLYVVLAAALNVPLVSADKRLASAPNLPCVVELVG